MRKKLLQRLTVIGLSLVLAFTGVSPVMAENPSETEESEVSEECVTQEECEISVSDIAPGTIVKDTGDMQIIYAPENVPSIDTESAENPTQEEVYNAIIAQKAYYPEGMTYTNANPEGGYLFTAIPGWNVRGYGCAAFAYIMSDAAFGSLPAKEIKTFDWDAFRVGDILRINNDTHSVIILTKGSDYVTVAEANYGSTVHWGRKIYKDKLEPGFTHYITRYPDAVGTGDNTFTKGISCTFKDIRTEKDVTFQSDNGKMKVLAFGGYGSCGNCAATIPGFISVADSLGGLKQTEFWAFDIADNDDDVIVSAFEKSDKDGRFKVTNSTTEFDKWSEVYAEYIYYAAREVGDSLTMPICFFLDGKGNILDFTTGYLQKYEIKELFEKYDYASAVEEEPSDPDDPTAPDTPGTPGNPPASQDQVELTQGFVDRLYSIALNRTYDSVELQYWTDELLSGAQTGAKVASGFIFSPEMNMKKLSDADYVKTLYDVMMGRTPSEADIAYWTELMENGYGKEGVFREFVDSREFNGICSDYGITAGNYDVTGASRNPGLSAFMSRLYTKALGRSFDMSGLDYWCEEYYQGNYSLMQISTEQFFHSAEFEQKNLDNEGYIKVLYRTFFGRECNAADLTYWQGELFIGRSRDDLLYDFYASPEFGIIKAQYGF